MSSARGSLPSLGCGSRTGSTIPLSDRMTEGPRIQSWDDSGERSTWHLASDDEAQSDLHTRLAHIQWRKNENDRKIRRALDTTKHMYDRDMMLQLSHDREEERKQWTEAIICDELACTAEIPEKFLREWKQRKDDHRKRCLKEVSLHLKSIKRVERALNSKWGADGKVMQLLNEDSTQGEQHRVLSGGRIDSSVELKDKMWTLRREMEEKRRELRPAEQKHWGKGGGFRAANYKTGRGRV